MRTSGVMLFFAMGLLLGDLNHRVEPLISTMAIFVLAVLGVICVYKENKEKGDQS